MTKAAACFALLFALSTPFVSFAQESVRICFEEWAPFAETRDEKPAGIQIDIMQRAFDRARISVQFFEMPYVRCLQNVRAGRFDAILASSDEAGLTPMNISVLRWELGVFVHEDRPGLVFQSFDDFVGKQIGLVDGYDYGPNIMDRLTDWDVQEAPDAVFNLRKLAKQRIDFTITDVLWAQTVIRKENLPIKALFPTIKSIPQYTYFHPERADIIPLIEAAMFEMKADGTIELIYRRQTGFGVPSRWLAQ